MISEAVAPVVIVKILAAKVIIGMISGLVVEFLYVGVMKKHEKEMDTMWYVRKNTAAARTAFSGLHSNIP